MAESYERAGGGPVENESYCMPSWNARNVKEANDKMGYHNMGDRANSRTPTAMKGAKVNKQIMK